MEVVSIIMLRYILAVLMCFSLGILSSCGMEGGKASKELVIYSEMEPNYTEALLAAYNEQYKQTKNFQPAKAIYELSDKVAKPDLVLASNRTLNGLKLDERLQLSNCQEANLLPDYYKDSDGYWIGVIYDPVVFVVNQSFARRVGQGNITSWADLENMKNVRYVVENLNNSQGTMSLLAAMASHMGEQEAISYIWNLNRNVTAYGRFPFSTIRMVATGEADMTVTVMSMVAKYLENEFPAYCIEPKEGAPANLYGVAVFKDSKSTFSNQQFMNWLLVDDNARIVTQKKEAGYMFLLPQGDKQPAVDPKRIWLNTNYLTLPKLEALTSQWVEKVRFSN